MRADRHAEGDRGGLALHLMEHQAVFVTAETPLPVSAVAVTMIFAIR